MWDKIVIDFLLRNIEYICFIARSTFVFIEKSEMLFHRAKQLGKTGR